MIKTSARLFALILASPVAPSLALAQGPDGVSSSMGVVTLAAAISPDEPGAAASEASGGSWADRVSLTLSADWTTAYFFRGVRQEDEGFILQPAAALSVAAFKTDDLTVNLNFSTWHSLHDNRTAARADAGSGYRAWYEADYVAGASVVSGPWTFGLAYAWLDSPSDAFVQVQEVQLSGAFDDSGPMGAWALKPTALVVIESGRGATDGRDRGSSLQLGINPGLDVQLTDSMKLRVDLPTNAGFSLGRYYQEASGGDDWFGFASSGPKLTLPLPLPTGWGAWSLTGSATFIHLGDNARDFNGGNPNQWFFGAGIVVTF